MKQIIITICLALTLVACSTKPKVVVLQSNDHSTIIYAEDAEKIIIIDMEGSLVEEDL